MKFNIITIFPDLINNFLQFGLIGKALQKKIWELNVIDLKTFDFLIDDRPISGGAGMIIRAPILEKSIINLNKPIIYLSPRGPIFNQNKAKELMKNKEITLICGRYEGIDQRFIDYYNIEELSIGDFILCGGEVASLVIPATTSYANKVLRLTVDVRLFQQTNSEYASAYMYFKKPVVVDFAEIA